MVDNEKLLPCPFCGSKAEIRTSSLHYPGASKYYYPTCTSEYDCPGIVYEQDEQGGTCCDCRTPSEAAEIWNRRHNHG